MTFFDLLRTHAPELHVTLRPGATRDAIASAEATLGRPLPPALARMYLSHDGQRAGSPGLFRAWRWLPLSEVLESWARWCRLLEAGDIDAWSPAWVPFTHDFGGNHHCVDLTCGEVFELYHDDDDHRPRTPSVGEWLDALGAEWSGV